MYRIAAIAGAVAMTITMVFALAAAAQAAEVKVMISGDFSSAYQTLAPQFERATENTVVKGEPADVIILVAPGLDELVRQGKILKDSRVDLARRASGEPKKFTIFSAAVAAGAKRTGN